MIQRLLLGLSWTNSSASWLTGMSWDYLLRLIWRSFWLAITLTVQFETSFGGQCMATTNAEVRGVPGRIESEIAVLKRRIEDNQEQLARLRGQHDQLMKQLQEDYQLSNVEDATAYLERLKADVDALHKQVRVGVDEIRMELGW